MGSLQVAIKLLDKAMPAPAYAHESDAAVDLRATEDLVIGPGDRALVPTGIAVAIPFGFGGLVIPRSGLAIKHGISVVNAPGLIDSGYRGEIKVILLNTDKEAPFEVKRGDRIAQLAIVPMPHIDFQVVDSLEESDRGASGFGSTGV